MAAGTTGEGGASVNTDVNRIEVTGRMRQRVEEERAGLPRQHASLIQVGGAPQYQVPTAGYAEAPHQALARDPINTHNLPGREGISIGPIGSRRAMLTAHFRAPIIGARLADGPWLQTGCFSGPLVKFEAQVMSTYPDPGNVYRQEYHAAIALIRLLAEIYEAQA